MVSSGVSEMKKCVSPFKVPDEVGLDWLGGEAEVSDGVNQDQKLGEEAFHQPVQQWPAETPAGGYGADLDVTSCKQKYIGGGRIISFPRMGQCFKEGRCV